MRSRVLLFIFFLTGFLLVQPLSVHAMIPFLGPIIPNATNTCAAGWGMIIIVINNIIEFLITIAIVFVAPIMIAYSGFLMVWNQGNSGQVTKARGILTNVVVGIVVALAAWMIVDAVMAVLYNSTTPVANGNGSNAGVLKTWSNIINWGNGDNLCLIQAGSLETLNQAVPTAGVSATGGATGVSRACTAPSSGPCSIANLQKSCFGSNATQAGQICSNESGGDPNIPSRVDLTSDGYAYSIGLFQINISNSFSQQVNGQNCRTAFSAPCQGIAVVSSGRCTSTVRDKSLYAACVVAAQNPTNNINQACRLSGNGSSWGSWRNVATACGLR